MTLSEKVIGWLNANPSKCINADDIADFFQVNRAKVATQLALAVREGELGFDDAGGEDAEPVWYLPKSDWAAERGKCSKGSAEKLFKANPAVKPQSAPAMLANAFMPLPKPRYTVRDFSTIKIEDDVPMDAPARGEDAQYVQLFNLFKKMKPQQSVLIPNCNAIRHAAALFNKEPKQRVVCRKVDDDNTRVWRTE